MSKLLFARYDTLAVSLAMLAGYALSVFWLGEVWVVTLAFNAAIGALALRGEIKAARAVLTIFVRLGLVLVAAAQIVFWGSAPWGEGLIAAPFAFLAAFSQENLFLSFFTLVLITAVLHLLAGRVSTAISQTQARYVLYTMPSESIAIDADLNAALIDEENAQERRQKDNRLVASL